MTHPDLFTFEYFDTLATFSGWSAAKSKAINGTAKDDILAGTNKANQINGRAGDDELTGKGGKDILNGGTGDDVIYGGKGNDVFIVSDGGDALYGGAGKDTLDASAFHSGVVANVTSGNQAYPSIPPGVVILPDDVIQSITGIEQFIGSRFDDSFFASAPRVKLIGGNGDDYLFAQGDRSVVNGGNGDDRLEVRGANSKAIGGRGDDHFQGFGPGQTLLGGAGNDEFLFTFGGGTKVGVKASVIRGGAGNDTFKWLDNDTNRDLYPEVFKVFGGSGADIFDFGYYHSGTIQDFKVGVDKVDLSLHLSKEDTSFSELMTMVTDTANGAVLTLDYSTVSGFDFVFKGVSAADFIEGDFIL